MSDVVLSKQVVHGLERCPQCGVAKPYVTQIGKSDKTFVIHPYSFWFFTGKCSKCSHHILFSGTDDAKSDGSFVKVNHIWPEIKGADESLPQKAKRFLQQAIESKHAPDGAVMLAASSVDSMLKEKGLRSGTLYQRIEKAADDHLLTEEMRAWAHEIRLDSNDPRHADDNFDGFEITDAERAIDFASALGEYLFVLPERVRRWRSAEKIA